MPRTVAYLVGGVVTLVLAVAFVRPAEGVSDAVPAGWWTGDGCVALAREPGVVRSHALRAAVLVALATLGYRLLHVPDGYWIPLAVVAVLQPDSVASRTRAIQRALGTLVGVAAAGAVIAAAPSETCPRGLRVRDRRRHVRPEGPQLLLDGGPAHARWSC